MNHKDPDTRKQLIVAVKSQVALNAPRVKELGNWPSHVDEMSLVHRIPDEREKRLTAPGFDAGIACCLDLIPRDKQRLSAILHGAYTPEAVEQIRSEVESIIEFGALTANETDQVLEVAFNSETTWWLAASSVCDDGDKSSEDVLDQVRSFERLIKNSSGRWIAALDEYRKMEKSFHVVDNIAISLRDGGMQAAYIHGYPLAIMPAYGTWFVGTFYPTLGVPEDFPWGDKKDEKDRPMSGPVFGSKQFVKCATFDELEALLNYARDELADQLANLKG
jgi:hypothetical protein